MTARVIGVGGKLRAGKDALSDFLVGGYGFAKLGMSDALNEAMLVLNPLIPINASASSLGLHGEFIRYTDLIYEVGYVEAKKNPEVRRLLQQLGTDVGRNMIGENVWVNITARKIDDHLYADRPVVLTGVRFLNELAMIRQFAGECWWVERPGKGGALEHSTHASENGVTGDLFDRVIHNDGSLEDLYAKVASLLQH